MKNLNYKKFINYFSLFLIIFLIDRFTKIYVLSLAEKNDNLQIYINQFLNIILVWNTGIGFGLLSFSDQITYNFITTIIIFINLFIIYLIYSSDNTQSIIYLIILGGSFGNLFDRLYYSAVPDFIDLNYNGFHWFVFNFADIFISIGIICLIFIELLNYKKFNKK